MSNRPLAAAAWMSGSILSFTAMAVAGRAVSDVHDTFEIMFWRSLTGLVLVVLTAALLGRLSEVQTRHLPQHLL
ncbi:MAG: EamA family transporter, partial [Gemmobacter sp.]|nr:EamA family transporter [Gemmobacter sp.]